MPKSLVTIHWCFYLWSVQFTTLIWSANKGHDYRSSCPSQACVWHRWSGQVTESLKVCKTGRSSERAVCLFTCFTPDTHTALHVLYSWLRDGSDRHCNKAQIAGVLLWVFSRAGIFPLRALCPALVVSLAPWPVMCEHILTWCLSYSLWVKRSA